MNSQIDILIKQLCPIGVEKVNIKDCCTVSIGEFVHKDLQSDDYVYPVYNGGTSFTGFYKNYNNSGNKVIVSARGANAGFVNRVYSPFWAGNSCYSITADEDKLKWNYLYYVLKSSETKLIESQQKGGGIPSISKAQMERFQIPLPPLAIQQEIVNILDKFTTVIDKIDEEINLRQKQYEYYREKLLTFEEGECEWKTINSFTHVLRGKRLTKNMLSTENKYPVYHGGNEPIGFYGEANRQANTVMVINVGASAGTVGFCDKEFWSSDGCFCIEKTNDIDDKYMFHTLKIREQKIMAKVRTAGIPTLDNSVIERLEIPVPSKEKQHTIVQTLDKFETLIGKLKEERALRQKQYEYYREKLLTFE